MTHEEVIRCHHWLVKDLQSTLSEIHSRVAGSDFRLICGHCSTSVAGQVGNFKEPPHRIVWYRGNSWFGTFKPMEVKP